MNQELIDFIKRGRQSGQNDDQIKENLLQAGWQVGDIMDALAAGTKSDFDWRNSKFVFGLAGVLIGIFIGVAAAWATLFLNFKINNGTVDFSASPNIPNFPTSGKDLCQVLTKEAINALIPGLNLVKSEKGLLNCAYFKDQNQTSAIDFFNILNFDAIKKSQKDGGANIKELVGMGDEAFFANLPGTGNGLGINNLIFRLGKFVYVINGLSLTENQLKVIANAAIQKLR